jgi:hypothetical protein
VASNKCSVFKLVMVQSGGLSSFFGRKGILHHTGESVKILATDK